MRTFPFLLGGGLDEPQKTYRMLRKAEGVGGSAPNEQGIDGLWRRARAIGLSAATSAYRRAILNTFPHKATDLIPYYERLYGLHPSPDATEADRRAAIVLADIAKASAAIPDVLAELQAIDSRFELITTSESDQTYSQDGRWFGGIAVTEPAFHGVPGAGGASIAAQYTTRYVLRILFDVGYTGALNPGDRALKAAADAKLRVLMPPWWDWSITTSTGFVLDSSPLDITGLST